MSKTFDVNESFVVKQISNFVFIKVMIVFLLIIATVGYYFQVEQSYTVIIVGLGFFALLLYILIKKNKADIIYITVNSKGIFVKKKLLTNWNNYIKSYVKLKFENSEDFLDDNYFDRRNLRYVLKVLHVDFYKVGESGYFIHQFNFTGNEDKLETEVIEAINFYYEQNKF